MSISKSTDNERAWAISAELRRKLLAALTDPDDCRPMMSYEEFLDWLDEDTLAEWVDGESDYGKSREHTAPAHRDVSVESAFLVRRAS